MDDGRGMTRRELSRYHDLATSTKRRGRGIGFAGVGIKLGLLACDEVVTETRRGRQHAATSWRLANRTRAPWSWIEPPHLLEQDGTAVLLTSLADRHPGGQRRLPFGDPAAHAATGPVSSAEPIAATPPGDPAAGGRTGHGHEGAAGESGPGQPDGADTPPTASESPGREATAPAAGQTASARLPARAGRKRPATLSLQVRFESRPADLTLGRLIESTIWINDAHPAYRRAVASRAEGYHIALAVAAALAPLTVEPAMTQRFVNAFLARWGEAAVDNGKGR